MNIFLTIAIVLANLISIFTVYQFIKRLDHKQVVIFIAVSVAIMYMLISIIYWLSGFGIDEKIHEASKNFVQYIFVPVNVLLFIPYIASKYMKLKENEITRSEFANKIEILAILLIVVLVIEFFYFRDIQANITSTYLSMNTLEQTNTIVTNEVR